MSDVPFLAFSQRRRLAALFEKFCRDNQVKNCTESVIAFLQGNGLLDKGKCIEYLEEKKGVNTDV